MKTMVQDCLIIHKITGSSVLYILPTHLPPTKQTNFLLKLNFMEGEGAPCACAYSGEFAWNFLSLTFYFYNFSHCVSDVDD